MLGPRPEMVGDVAQVLSQLEQIELALRDGDRDEVLASARPSRPRKAESVSHYDLTEMRGRDQASLTEYRRSGAEPFRCPFDTYGGVAEAVAAMKGPFKFEELQKAVNARVDTPVSSYQVRLCLRYWICRGIVQHQRARFSAASGRGFVDAAVKLFNSLADGAHYL
jgi:hypothetical protein